MGPSAQLYGANMSNPYGGHTVFVHLLHMVPMWVAHMGPRTCTQFPQILPTVPPMCYSYIYSFCPLVSYGPMWIANMQYGSHVGCLYGSQILPTFPLYLAHISAFKSPIRFLSACFIRLPRGLLNKVPVRGEMKHCTTSRIMYSNVVMRCV